MPFGVTAAGFVPKTVTDLVTELGDAWKVIFGGRVNLDPRSRNGQLIGSLAERLSEVWDLAQAVYSAFDPNSATGSQLDALGALSGVVRLPSSYSTVTLRATGTNGTVLPIGRVISVSGTGGVTRFETTEEITIGASPTDVEARSTETGEVVGNAGTITVIETPVAGWASVTNLLDADVGDNVESDSAFRVRRAASLRGQGTSSLDAMRSRLLEVPAVTSVNAFENTSSTTSVDGLPPHSVEMVIAGGADAAIRELIFASRPAGIESYGSVSGSVLDSQGESHVEKFSRPTNTNIYVTFELVVDPATYPADGDQQVEAAAILYGDSFPPGKDVIASQFAAVALGIEGVMDAIVKIGLSASPTLSTTLKMNLRQWAKFDTSRTTINNVEGTT